MTPRSFDYFRPKTIEEAVRFLNMEDAKVLAGGQSLVALMKLRLVSPRNIVDIGQIPGLSGITTKDGGLTIGALTTHDEIENSQSIRKLSPILSEAASMIGDQQVRNRGTIGGSLCHADPAGDYLPVILALDSVMVASGPNGDRRIKAVDFFVDFFTTALKSNEILTRIEVPSLKDAGTAYTKLSRRRGDFAIASTAAVIVADGNSICRKAAVALGAMSSVPLKARRVEEMLIGKSLNDENIERAAQYADDGTDPVSDLHGSAAYRKEMAKVITKRTIKTAVSRVGGR